jgi:tetratricopeptide (TPR) repeat protein
LRSSGCPWDVEKEALARLAESQQVDPQVQDALFQARFHWKRLTEEGLNTALAYYELALERDSTSVEAWIGTAGIWNGLAQGGFISGVEAGRRGEAAMARAQELDPDASQDLAGRALRVTWFDWNWAEGESLFLRALDEDPLDATTRAYYALLLLYFGRVEEATAEIERASEMDPFSSVVQMLYGQNLNFRRLPEEAEAVLLGVLERDPGYPDARSALRTTYHLMGRYQEAIEAWEPWYRERGDEEAADVLASAYGKSGYAAALEAVAELLITRLATEDSRPWQVATLYARAGNVERTLLYLQMAYDEHELNMASIRIDPIFDHVADEPAFLSLLDGLGLAH